MEKRLQILDAAARVFYERGVRKASFGDIAKEAGISRPTLYAAFEDKNAIMLAAIYHVSEKLLQTIKDQLADKLTAQERFGYSRRFALLNHTGLSSNPRMRPISSVVIMKRARRPSGIRWSNVLSF